MNKKGLSLIILIITILLILVLIGITTAGIGNAVQNARMSSFGTDLNNIEDAVNLYYVQNGEFPVLLENNAKVEYVYSTDKLQAKTGSNTIALNASYLNQFKEELVKNGDLTSGENVVSDTVFYKIDLAKIDVKETSRGLGKDGANDIYVLSYPSQTVYYVKGVMIDNKIYFSLKNISDVKEVVDPNAGVEVQEETGVIVEKEKKAWTNKLGIKITANLTATEKLYIKLPVGKEITLATTTGNNTININSLNGSLGLSQTEIDAFNSLDLTEKYMRVIKKDNGEVVSNIKVNLANYETQAPSFPYKSDGVTFDFNIESFDGYNKVSYKGKDNISGIKEVRYVYLTQFNYDASIKTLQAADASVLTSKYMLENGMKAYVANDGNVEIKLPKDIEAIYITMFDKAGNSVSMQKNVQSDMYIGITPVSMSSNLSFNIAIKSTNGVAISNASISVDEQNYVDEQTLELTNKGNNIYTGNVTFQNSKDPIVYVKVAAKDKSAEPKYETRIKKIDLSEFASKFASTAMPGLAYEEHRYYTDLNGDTAIVPAGFMVSEKYTEQIIDNGLVIIDGNGNEFVWVPCTTDGSNGSVKYTRRFSEYPKNSSITSVSDDASALPTDASGNRINETTQITNYKGFYVGRYEAGIPANQTAITGKSKSDSDKSGVPVVQKNQAPWGYISYINAVPNSKLVCNTAKVKSGLITGTQWDTICDWLSKGNSPVSVTNSTSWGNFRDDPVDNQSVIKNTGSQEQWKAKNIYDFAGNEYEWTSEVNSSYYVNRGGSYYYTGSGHPAAFRGRGENTTAVADLSFRVVLYVL